MNLYTLHLRPLLEYASPLWNVGFLGDVRMLERLQRRWTRAVVGLEDLPYEERLQRLDLFSFQGRLLRTDLILVYKIMQGLCSITPEDFFTLNDSTATRGHPCKLFKPRIRLEARKRFFSIRVINTWNSLSSDTVTADNVDKFKANLKRDLGQALYDFV